MRKRRNTKRRRRIILIIKGSIFIITVCAMFSFLTSKNGSQTSLPSTFPPTDKVAENTLPKSTKISIKGLSQEGIPTGCESVSTVAVLQHYGVNITIDEFINNFLPCKEFYKIGSKVYGANPHEYFSGNPYKTASLGCYPKVILKALNEMKNSKTVQTSDPKMYPEIKNLDFRNTTGSSIDALTTQYIDNQIPVILWVTIHMKQPYEGMKYYLEDGTLYTWTAQEHCTVLCGYDQNFYYLMDPLRDGEIVAYPKDLVKQRYNELGKYSLVIHPSS